MGTNQASGRTSQAVATLVSGTVRQSVRQEVVALAKQKFADLGSLSLEAATELWEVKDVLDDLREQYRAGMDQDCQRVVRQIDKFKRQHNL